MDNKHKQSACTTSTILERHLSLGTTASSAGIILKFTIMLFTKVSLTLKTVLSYIFYELITVGKRNCMQV